MTHIRIFGTFVNQVKWLLALSYRQFEAIHHKFHYKCPLKKPLVKGGGIATEIFESETLWAANIEKQSV